MIPPVTLAKGQLRSSRLAFGLSRLHYVDSAMRQRLLSAAVDLGLCHLDTAPVYGDGLAERELGVFLKGGRSNVLVATKYGIPPDPLVTALPALSLPVRAARSVARRLGLWGMVRPPMTAAGLRLSVEQSLARMGRDRIDILHLHEPAADRIANAEALLAEVAGLKQRGLIRCLGLAGRWEGIAGLPRQLRDAADVVQTHEAEWVEESPPDITYGALAAGPQSGFQDGVKPEDAEARLRHALSRRPNGVVLVSTTRPHNLERLTAIAS